MKVGATKVLENMTVTIPKVVREALNLKPGDYIEWHSTNGKMVIKRRD